MFNKQLFKTRFEFYLRHWHAFGFTVIATRGQAVAQQLMNESWCNALLILWQQRVDEKVIIVGVDAPEQYDAFCTFLTVALNQFNIAVEQMLANKHDQQTFHIAFNRMLLETVHDVAEELQEWFAKNQNLKKN